MSGLSDEGFAAMQRLVGELMAAGQDPRVARDPAAVVRWQIYALRQMVRVAEEEVARRLAGGAGG